MACHGRLLCKAGSPQSAMITSHVGFPSSASGEPASSISFNTLSPATTSPNSTANRSADRCREMSRTAYRLRRGCPGPCLPLSLGWASRAMKNWLVFEFLPVLPIARSPRLLNFFFSPPCGTAAAQPCSRACDGGGGVLRPTTKSCSGDTRGGGWEAGAEGSTWSSLNFLPQMLSPPVPFPKEMSPTWHPVAHHYAPTRHGAR
jgi:hypothetical protein